MSDRDSRLHRQLRALPARRAPRTLLPRVLAAAAAAQAKPWWRKAWWTWTLPAQAAYILAVGAAAAPALRLGFAAASGGGAALSQAQAAAEGLWVLARAFWRLGGQPLQGLVVAMAALSAAFATGLARLTERAAPARTI